MIYLLYLYLFSVTKYHFCLFWGISIFAWVHKTCWNWSKEVWNENISCHINQQEMAQASAISGFQMSTRDPKLQSNLADAATPTVIAEELEECNIIIICVFVYIGIYHFRLVLDTGKKLITIYQK